MSTTKINKLEIAISQLQHAITLFLEERELISAITLAGAAEEILGKLVTQAGLVSAVIRRTENARSLHKYLWKSDAGFKEIVNIKNKTRNELKHLVSGTPIEVNLEEETMRLLNRAVENYRLLHVQAAPFIRDYERQRLVLWRKRSGHS